MQLSKRHAFSLYGTYLNMISFNIKETLYTHTQMKDEETFTVTGVCVFVLVGTAIREKDSNK